MSFLEVAVPAVVGGLIGWLIGRRQGWVVARLGRSWQPWKRP